MIPLPGQGNWWGGGNRGEISGVQVVIREREKGKFLGREREVNTESGRGKTIISMLLTMHCKKNVCNTHNSVYKYTY